MKTVLYPLLVGFALFAQAASEMCVYHHAFGNDTYHSCDDGCCYSYIDPCCINYFSWADNYRLYVILPLSGVFLFCLIISVIIYQRRIRLQRLRALQNQRNVTMAPANGPGCSTTYPYNPQTDPTTGALTNFQTAYWNPAGPQSVTTTPAYSPYSQPPAYDNLQTTTTSTPGVDAPPPAYPGPDATSFPPTKY